jgi:hypothetical protein
MMGVLKGVDLLKLKDKKEIWLLLFKKDSLLLAKIFFLPSVNGRGQKC